MLKSLFIQNIVLIDKLEIKMASGLCVLSGETGSGKSILLDALGLAIGQRANSRLLRNGAAQGVAIAEFDISNNKIIQTLLAQNGLINDHDNDDKNNLILKRILFDGGTSKAFINDLPVSLNLLCAIGEALIEIHGQHEQRGLLDVFRHKIILDEFGCLTELVKSVNLAFREWQEVLYKLDLLAKNKEQNQKEKDYLEHIIAELENANITPNEEEMLISRRYSLLNGKKLENLISELEVKFNEADGQLFNSQKLLIKNQHLDGENKLAKLTELTEEIIIKIQDAKTLLSSVNGGIQESELNLEEIEERLFLIHNLSRKFNLPIYQLPNFLQANKERLRALCDGENSIAARDEQKNKLYQDYFAKAEKLSRLRHKSATSLSAVMQDELAFLKMAKVKFLVKISKLEEKNYQADGIDSVRFMAATNQALPFDDIDKIASGGELSRFMLALKVALCQVKSVPIIIFDEVDTGIGGAVADAVSQRLKFLAKKLQIMVITHHAQIAARGDYNLRVEKINGANDVKIKVEILNEKEKEQEIARMLSGDKISVEAVAAAKKLISG